MIHKPVLLEEVLKYLSPRPNENFIDATINGGGHAQAILSRVSPDGKLLGIDMDGDLIEALKIKYQKSNIKNIVLAQGNFADIAEIVKENNFNSINGILFDLGISSYHIDQSAGGFSFMKDEPLDMRFSRSNDFFGSLASKGSKASRYGAGAEKELTAAEIVNQWPERELVRIFKEYGEEPQAKKIARIIVEARAKNQIKTTGELVEILDKSNQFDKLTTSRTNKSVRSYKMLARVFQSLRIAVNDELENISRGLAGAWSVLEPGGRIAVISFHSLEDRLVKNFFKEKKYVGLAEILTAKPIQPTKHEIKLNSRSRSAKLRVIKKLEFRK